VNRQIRLVGVGIMLLFVVLFVQLNYLQVVHAPALNESPLNTERVVAEYDKPRGAIVSADGVTLAQSVKAPKGSAFTYRREYPTGSLFGQITGYYSFIYGSDGVEKTYDAVLSGAERKVDLNFSNLSGNLRQLLLANNLSQNVTLTLSDKLQQVARTGLAGRTGSVVAIDPSTGGILTAYSNPSYDPAGLSQLSTAKETDVWKQLLAAPGNPLSPGSYRNVWFPGSTFKVVTAAAVYDHDPSLATKSYPTLAALPLPQTSDELHNFGGEVCGGQLPELLTVSCDTGFGQVGLDLGGGRLETEARAFGFDRTPPIDLPAPAQSYFPPASSFPKALPTLAFSAIGQDNVSATPLEMAMVAAGIADHGTIMTPHVLARVSDAQNAVVSTYQPKAWLHATSPATAATMTTLMESVVTSGTAQAAQIPGVAVAGKTGTAQTGTGLTDDWFIAFAPAAHPTIAVAVVLPDEPADDEYQGGTLAAPIAKAVIEAFLAGGTTTGPSTTGPSGATTTAPTTGTGPSTTTPSATTPSATTPSATTPSATTPSTTPTTPGTGTGSTTTETPTTGTPATATPATTVPSPATTADPSAPVTAPGAPQSGPPTTAKGG
jgi:peptidoglycan glycosyltransferase